MLLSDKKSRAFVVLLKLFYFESCLATVKGFYCPSVDSFKIRSAAGNAVISFIACL